MNISGIKSVTSKFGGKLRSLVPQKIKNYAVHLPRAFLAALFYRFPAQKMTVIGVTGTDGKTTTVSLIYQILNQAGKKTAMISTVSAVIGKEEIDTGFHVTTPNPWKLQEIVRKMADSKIKYLVLEVTSHGLDQFRLWGIPFEIGVLTNVTREHLDYHKTYENYLATKAKLLCSAQVAILNKDDQSYNFFKLKIGDWFSKVITYGIKSEADFTPKKFKFETRLPGVYNQYNCLAAIAAASQLKIPQKTIKAAVLSFEGVVGRMQEIKEGQDFQVFIDFAHTPNALEQVLGFLKSFKPANSRLIVVFGAAGLRDTQKRPLMGEIATKLADLAVLTAEDPRTEKVEEIINQISGGCQKAGGKENETFYRQTDRREAINFAIQKLARKGDLVVVCGKGHEKSMCFGQVESPWSDEKAVRTALEERKTSQRRQNEIVF